MKIIFAGSSKIAVPSLQALFQLHNECGFSLAGIITNPDSAKGRSNEATPTDIGTAAECFTGTPPEILKPLLFDDDFFNKVAALKPDILISFAFGTIFKNEFLNIFPLGGINIHPSLLPRYRGATPVNAAILNRDTETGITIQRITEKVDSGSILAQERIVLNGRETSAALSGIVAEKAAPLLVSVLKKIKDGTAAEIQQDESAASYCSLLKKTSGIINWNRSACEIDAQIRAYTPWPLSFTTHNGQTLFILEGSPYDGHAENAVKTANAYRTGTVLGIDKKAGILIQTGNGIYAAARLQYRTKKALDWKSFLNGAKNFQGSILYMPGFESIVSS